MYYVTEGLLKQASCSAILVLAAFPWLPLCLPQLALGGRLVQVTGAGGEEAVVHFEKWARILNFEV